MEYLTRNFNLTNILRGREHDGREIAFLQIFNSCLIRREVARSNGLGRSCSQEGRSAWPTDRLWAPLGRSQNIRAGKSVHIGPPLSYFPRHKCKWGNKFTTQQNFQIQLAFVWVWNRESRSWDDDTPKCLWYCSHYFSSFSMSRQALQLFNLKHPSNWAASLSFEGRWASEPVSQTRPRLFLESASILGSTTEFAPQLLWTWQMTWKHAFLCSPSSVKAAVKYYYYGFGQQEGGRGFRNLIQTFFGTKITFFTKQLFNPFWSIISPLWSPFCLFLVQQHHVKPNLQGRRGTPQNPQSWIWRLPSSVVHKFVFLRLNSG